MQHNDIQLMRKREHCPSCRSTCFVSLCTESFTGPGMRKYIDTHYKSRASINLDGFSYELVQCAECNLAYQIHVPTNSLLSEIYDVWIPQSTREERRATHNLNYYRYLSEQVQFFIQHFHLPPSSINVLDFGFGWAEFAKMVMAYGCNVAGSELSQERIGYARSIGLEVVDTQELPANRFHFINAEQILEHIVEPRDLLTRLTASLEVGGIIMISVPNSSRSLRKLRRTRDFSSLSPNDIIPIAPLEHLNSFNYKSLVALADTFGLKPVRPSLYKLYNSASGWLEVKNAIRLIARPLYRHVYPKSTFVYFVRT